MSMMLVPAKGGKKKGKEEAETTAEKSEQPQELHPAESNVKE
jgi:hypothetical protein